MNKVLESFGDTIRSLQTDPEHSNSKPGDIELAVTLFENLSKPKPAHTDSLPIEPFQESSISTNCKPRFFSDIKKAFLITLLFFIFQQPLLNPIFSLLSSKPIIQFGFKLVLFFLISIILFRMFQ